MPENTSLRKPSSLAARASAEIAKATLVRGLLIFVPAWTVDFWQAWLYLSVFFLLTAAIAVHLWRTDPALLARRLDAGPSAEQQTGQRGIQRLTGVGLVLLFTIAALDHRFGWAQASLAVVIAGNALLVAGSAIVFVVLQENSYASSAIGVFADQRVIATGPYAVVRHPMYCGVLVMLCGTPLALGSWCGLLAFMPLAALTVWRLRVEERFLAANLPGYREYCERVPYRLLWRLW